MQERLKEALPSLLSDRERIAYRLLPKAMDAIFGARNSAWKTEKRASRSGKGAVHFFAHGVLRAHIAQALSVCSRLEML